MGYLAILADAEAGSAEEVAETQPQAERCHVNFWSLPSLVPGRRLFYMDVGVEVVAGASPLQSVQLLLPFRVEKGKWPGGSTALGSDLYSSVVDLDTAELIFGGPVTGTTTSTGTELVVGDYTAPLRILRVAATKIEEIDHQDRQDSSLVRVPLERSLAPGERGYFRIRWRIFGASPLWRWKRLSGGARVDFRVCDVRESHARDEDRHLRDRVMPIGQVNVFLMASPNQQLMAHSPDFRYLRTLEPRAWGSYLKTATHFGRVRGLLVYYWRSHSDEPVCPDNPFRIFLDFNRAASAAWWMQIARGMVAVAGALLLMNLLLGTSLDWRRLAEWDLSKALPFLGVTTALGILTWVGKIRGWASGRFVRPRSWLRARERWALQFTQKG